MLVAFPKLCIDKKPFLSDVGHDGSVPVKPFVCAGNALLAGFGVVKRCDVDIQRYLTRWQRGGRHIVGTEHTDIRLEDLRP